jgi:hypothetical protein
MGIVGMFISKIRLGVVQKLCISPLVLSFCHRKLAVFLVLRLAALNWRKVRRAGLGARTICSIVCLLRLLERISSMRFW